MNQEERCVSLTKRGERCQNRRQFGNYCYVHKGTQKQKTDPQFAALLGGIANFFTILDLVHNHLPSLLAWIESIRASGMFASHRHRNDTDIPSRELTGQEIETIVGYAHCLRYSELSQALESLPSDVRQKLDSSASYLISLAQPYFDLRNQYETAIYDGGRQLLEVLENFEEEEPEHLRSIFLDLENVGGDWLDLTAPSSPNGYISYIRASSVQWRFHILAEYIESLDKISEVDLTAHQKSLVNFALKRQEIKTLCKSILRIEIKLEGLGGSYAKYEP